MKLYEIANQFQLTYEALKNLDISDEEMQDTLGGIEMELESKILNLGATIISIDDETTILEKHLYALKERRAKFERRSTRIKEYILEQMQNCNRVKVHSNSFDVTVKTNPPAVEIVEESELAPEFYIEQFIAKIDKRKIKAALQDGIIVKGAKLTQHQRLEVK